MSTKNSTGGDTQTAIQGAANKNYAAAYKALQAQVGANNVTEPMRQAIARPSENNAVQSVLSPTGDSKIALRPAWWLTARWRLTVISLFCPRWNPGVRCPDRRGSLGI